MLTILSYCNRDDAITLKLFDWINQLGGCHNHDLLLIHDTRADKNLVQAILGAARAGWGSVYSHQNRAIVDGWPAGANYVFKLGATMASQKPELKYFFWLEPDAIPLKEKWLDMIEEEYLKAGKAFMGDHVQVGEIPEHMSGVGVYMNPIYALAGEALRSNEEAWDMAARFQILPNAHFTTLIEHSWKHPEFKNQQEVDAQIAKETVLFHASKDGSLIGLLRERRNSDQEFTDYFPVRKSDQPAEKRSSDTRSVTGAPLSGKGGETLSSCDILIRSYPADYQWLSYCLQAIAKFAKGFGNIWIASSHPNAGVELFGAKWVTVEEETKDGYLAQQITKLYADMITEHQSDFILHIDSDVILTRDIHPAMFLNAQGNKVIWPYLPYSEIPEQYKTIDWQGITQKFMQIPIQHEFMRRFPFMLPRWLYPQFRNHCHLIHGQVISQYISNQPLHEFSEFNAMGAYAWTYHRDKFHWLNASQLGDPVCKQFRTYMGMNNPMRNVITPEIRAEIETILRGTGNNVIAAGNSFSPPEQPAAPVPPQRIKKCRFGNDEAWVLDGDNISRWAQESNRIDHDQYLLGKILPYIMVGDTVIDVGAYIGDHTVAYSAAAGDTGRVIAFEPNPQAFACLQHNTKNLSNVLAIECGLSDRLERVPLSGNNGNWDGAYVGEHMKIADAQLQTLDSWSHFKPRLIKIDVEGYELRVLKGAEKMILSNRPYLVIEINFEALRRQASYPGEIFSYLKDHGYSWHIMQENTGRTSPLYDIFCSPLAATLVSSQEEGLLGESVPPKAPLTPYGEMLSAIALLKKMAGQSRNDRTRVMINLSKQGLTPRWPKGRKRKRHARTTL